MLILASASPRRYQILSLLNLPFLMVPPDLAEVNSESRSTEQEALYWANRKAASLMACFQGSVVIGSDTLISLEGVKIGKPVDTDDARNILRRLRGRTHEVVTAVVLLEAPSILPLPSEGEGRGEGGHAGSFEWVETARVTMRDFSEADLEAYLATDDSLDKAGAYSVQGAGRHLIAGVDGDFPAVVGLPLRAVVEGLKRMGMPVVADVDRLYRERAFLNWRMFD